jgi:hypothetical protein
MAETGLASPRVRGGIKSFCALFSKSAAFFLVYRPA